MKKSLNVAVVGATGLIGSKFIPVLEKRNFPVNKLKVFASKKSEGKKIRAFGTEHVVQPLDNGCFVGIDLVFFSAGKEISLKYAPIAVNEGAYVIDNSSAFRENPQIPLIIPEINGNILQTTKARLIANPNCSTSIAILPLLALEKNFGLKKIIYTTYQAVSGSGQKGLADLIRCRNGKTPTFYQTDVSKNFIPKIGGYSIFGYTEEEVKMIKETKKILGKEVSVSATCVRVPVENCHGISVEVELEKEFYDEDIKSLFRKMEGTTLYELPTPNIADGKDEVFIGRIKRSLAFKNGLSYFCVGDNTLKGASLNAVQIAEKLIEYGKI